MLSVCNDGTMVMYFGTFLLQYKHILNGIRFVHEFVFNAKNKTRRKPQVNMLAFNLPVMELEAKFSATYNSSAVQKYFSDACCEKLGYVK